MTQKFYKTEEASKILGISPAEVTKLREERKLHGYRDGMDWKFKAEDVDRLAAEGSGGADEETDVLLSEVELGQSESGKSGTVIGAGAAEGAPGDSDLQIGDSDLKLESARGGAASDLSDFEELDLALEEDLSLDDSKAPKAAAKKKAKPAEVKSGSDVDLAKGEGLEDDDLVLGGSGSGSDITMGGDSGISLVDPADSGLSLEEPLELATGGEETLELGEDDMITLSEDADLDSPTELKTEEDFTLTPMEEGGEEEDSESGSQVIALDEVEEAPVGVGAPAGRAAMLDEDFSAGPMLGITAAAGAAPLGGAPLGGPADMTAGAPLGAQVAMLPEAPYTGLNITALVLCALILTLTGMMMYDLVRNIWSWDSANAVSSPIMEFILGLFEGK